MNKKELWAKARFLMISTNPELKSGVSDNVFILDFSPKPEILKYLKKPALSKIL